jgi:hypothetical protein
MRHVYNQPGTLYERWANRSQGKNTTISDIYKQQKLEEKKVNQNIYKVYNRKMVKNENIKMPLKRNKNFSLNKGVSLGESAWDTTYNKGMYNKNVRTETKPFAEVPKDKDISQPKAADKPLPSIDLNVVQDVSPAVTVPVLSNGVWSNQPYLYGQNENKTKHYVPLLIGGIILIAILMSNN